LQTELAAGFPLGEDLAETEKEGPEVREFSPGFPIFKGKIASYNMTSASDIRNKVIDQLMTIKDANYLRALSDMIKSSHIQQETVPLTEEQKIMLVMSEDDILAGRTIDQLTLNERELEWLKRK
jgi:hypothetical protein